jgi:hypothetical protein
LEAVAVVAVVVTTLQGGLAVVAEDYQYLLTIL